jgi:hypothetical protein
MTITYVDDGANFRLLSDQASAAIQAACEAALASTLTARDQAIAAAGSVSRYGTDVIASGASGPASQPAGTVFSTEGKSTAGDGGGGKWIVEAADPGSTLKLDLNGSGKFARSLERVLRPEQFGVVAGSRNQEQGFIDLAAELRWRGGGRVAFPDYKEINVFDDLDFGGTNHNLFDITGTRGVTIDFNGTRLLCDNAFDSGGDDRLNLIFAVGLWDLKINGLDFEQTGYTDLGDSGGTTPLVGTRGTYLLNECIGVEATIRMKAGLAGFSMATTTGYDPAKPGRLFDVKVDTDIVYYPVSLGGTGNHGKAEAVTINAGRSSIVYGVHHLDLDVTSRHGGPFQDVLLKVYPDAAKPDSANALSDIKLKYKTIGRWKQGNPSWPNGQSCVALEIQQIDDANPKRGTIQNIDILLDIDSSPTNANAYRQMVGTAKWLKSGAADVTARGHIVDNIKISGRIYKPDTLGNPAINMFNNSAGTPEAGDWSGDNVRNISIENLSIDGFSAANDAISVNGAVVKNALKLANIVSSGKINVGTPAVGVLDASEQVSSPNLKSAVASGMTAGNSGYRRLPNGRVEMFGVTNAATNTNTAVTFPLTVTQVEEVKLTSMLVGASAQVNATSIGTTGMSVNATSAWAGGNVAWSVVARI